MTSTVAGLLLIFTILLVLAIVFVDAMLPSREQEEKQAKRDVEDMLKRANKEATTRRRVRG